jgi:adenylate kinase
LLVPDETTISMWSRNIQAATLQGNFNPERDTLVLDGIPRNPTQAEMLKDTLNVIGLIHLACLDRSKMIERLQRRALRENRLDDANLEVIKRRLETYDKETTPVLDYYGSKLVHEIDSTDHPVKVLRQILDVMVRL